MKISVTTPTRNTDAEARSHRRWLALARGIWLLLAAGMLTALVVGTPTYYAVLATICTAHHPDTDCVLAQLVPDGLLRLQQMGLSLETYAALIISIRVFASLPFLLVAALIFWRKSDDWSALLAAFILLLFGGLLGGVTQEALLLGSDVASIVVWGYGVLLWLGLGLFLFTFPTGRITPRWAWALTPLWLAQFALFLGAFDSWPTILQAAFFVLAWGPVGVQVYRYQRVYNHRQRQQVKWVIVGFLAFTLVLLGSLGLETLFGFQANRLDPFSQLVAIVIIWGLPFLPLPISIAIAILRSRLWDIDVIINKALVYGSLTGLLGALYAGLVIGLGSIAGAIIGQNESQQVVLVVSTLAIAALFRPLRRRRQAIIDRRFYRRKYDAARTVKAFSASLRNEVDLEQLRAGLLAVVTETMQPSRVSLWLRPAPSASKRQTAWKSAAPVSSSGGNKDQLA